MPYSTVLRRYGVRPLLRSHALCIEAARVLYYTVMYCTGQNSTTSSHRPSTRQWPHSSAAAHAVTQEHRVARHRELFKLPPSLAAYSVLRTCRTVCNAHRSEVLYLQYSRYTDVVQGKVV